MLVCPKTAVHFHSHLKVLRTEIASFGSRRQCKRAADAHGVAELEWRVFYVLLRNEIFGNRPALVIAAKYEFRFHLSLLLEPNLRSRFCQIIVAIAVDDFKQALVRTVYVLELDVQNRVNPVFTGQEPEPVFPSVAGEQSALTARG